MSKKLKATFSRPASDKKQTKLKTEPQEGPSEKSFDQIVENQKVKKPMTKAKESKKSSESIAVQPTNISKERIVEAEIEPEIEVEQGVDVDQVFLIEKKSSHHETKKTKKNPRLVSN